MSVTELPQNLFQGSLAEQINALPRPWQGVFTKPHIQSIIAELEQMLAARLAQGVQIFPKRPLRALIEIDPADVQVVIVGQDPYHGPNQAQGLAFSVPDFCKTPPSLRNIFKELALEYQVQEPPRNSLLRWARQGALLLNTALTVESGAAASHSKKGWEHITDAIIMRVLQEPRPKVFLLWGNHAQARQKLLDIQQPAGPVKVLIANHPSPLAASRPPRPFIGCGHFRAANEWLQAQGEPGIDWNLQHTPKAKPGYGG